MHTHKDDAKNAILNTNAKDNAPKGWFSVGLHPWNVTQNWRHDMQQVEEKAEMKNCIAIGEVGLDALVGDISMQKKAFERQVEISQRIDLPVIIHCVRLHEQILSIRKQKKAYQSWIFHGFNRKQTIATQILSQQGCFLFFGEAAVGNKNLEEVIFKTPLDRFFIETDQSKVGIEKIYSRIAEIKNIPLEEIIEKQRQNWMEVFFNKNKI